MGRTKYLHALKFAEAEKRHPNNQVESKQQSKWNCQTKCMCMLQKFCLLVLIGWMRNKWSVGISITVVHTASELHICTVCQTRDGKERLQYLLLTVNMMSLSACLPAGRLNTHTQYVKLSTADRSPKVSKSYSCTTGGQSISMLPKSNFFLPRQMNCRSACLPSAPRQVKKKKDLK
jgi:hypothetical protein